MAKNRDRRNRDDDDDLSSSNWSFPETQLDAAGLLDEVLRSGQIDDPKTRSTLFLLRNQIQTDKDQLKEAAELIGQYEEAYNKLTQPANRLGTYLGLPPEERTKRKVDPNKPDGDGEEKLALIAVGDQEYVVQVDPNIEDPEFEVGTRVKINEGYAVVGDLGPATNGPIAKIAEVLDDERLRVSSDPQGLQSRIV